MRSRTALVLACGIWAGCGEVLLGGLDAGDVAEDGGGRDVGVADVGEDAGPEDAGPVDGGHDAGPELVPVQVVREGDAASDGVILGASGAIACPPSCAANVAVGATVALAASASIDTSVFAGWVAGPCAGQGAECGYVVGPGQPANRARFSVNRLTVSVRGAPGRVVADVGGLDCDGDCDAVFVVGSQVVLSAVPDADSVFEGWSGGCAGASGECALTMDGPAAVEARFALRPPPVVDHQAADLVLGQPTFSADIANNGGEGLGSLNGPRSCHTDGARLWVADAGNARVLQWDTLPSQVFMQPAQVVIGQRSATAHVIGLSDVELGDTLGGIVSGPGGGLYIADRLAHRVLYWSAAPTAHGTPADAVIGQLTFETASEGTDAQHLYQPIAMAFAGSRLLVADTLNSRVIWYDQAPTTTGRPAATGVLGQGSFDTRLAPNPPGAGTMYYPFDVAYDPERDQLFVVDTNNHRVLGWNGFPSASQPADFVLGQLDLESNAVDAGQAGPNPVGMSGPREVLIHAGSLFVSDGGNSRVMVWSPVPSATGAPAQAVLGQADLHTRGARTSASDLSGPWGLCAAGDALFVVDIADHRALRYTLSR
jgi:hypothetical protein